MTYPAIPTFQQLCALQETGKQVGYRGIYIYLRYQAILTAMQNVRMSKVLSIGCGYGIFDRLLPETLDFTGVDTGESQIAFAQQWATEHRPSFHYQWGDFRSQGFARNSFDTIFLSEVIEHVPESELPGFFDTIHDLLQENGVLLLSVPNKWTLRNRVRHMFGRPLVIMDKTHLREYSLTEIRSFVRPLPFRIEKFSTAVLYFPCEFLIRKFLSPQNPLRRGVIALCPALASHFIFVLKKSPHS